MQVEFAKGIREIATEVAHSLVRISMRDENARLSLPLLYPGGSTVGVEISRLRDGFLVSDAGGARREAGLLGGERSFAQIAPEIAAQFGVRFDHNMFFDIDVSRDHLVVAVAAIANAAQSAVETTALRLATIEHADHLAMLWERLDNVFTKKSVARKPTLKGKRESWDFDAAVTADGRLTVFQIVTPYANSVNGAVTKFVDIRDLGKGAPNRVAALTNKDKTPHFAVLTSTARWVPVDASESIYRKAA